MESLKTYKFKGKILPDGHLLVPEELAELRGTEFEVFMAPVDGIKKLVSLYLEGNLEKKGTMRDINLDAAAIEDAIKAAFGTTEIHTIVDSVRK